MAMTDGELPAYDLGDYSNPLVLLVPYVAPVPIIAEYALRLRTASLVVRDVGFGAPSWTRTRDPQLRG